MTQSQTREIVIIELLKLLHNVKNLEFIILQFHFYLSLSYALYSMNIMA